MRAVCRGSRKLAPSQNWMVGNSVIREPVSGIMFPGNREIYREIRNFKSDLAVLVPDQHGNSVGYEKIPYT